MATSITTNASKRVHLVPSPTTVSVQTVSLRVLTVLVRPLALRVLANILLTALRVFRLVHLGTIRTTMFVNRVLLPVLLALGLQPAAHLAILGFSVVLLVSHVHLRVLRVLAHRPHALLVLVELLSETVASSRAHRASFFQTLDAKIALTHVILVLVLRHHALRVKVKTISTMVPVAHARLICTPRVEIVMSVI